MCDIGGGLATAEAEVDESFPWASAMVDDFLPELGKGDARRRDASETKPVLELACRIDEQTWLGRRW